HSEHTLKSLPSRATFILRPDDVLFPNAYDSMRGLAIVPPNFDGYIATNRFFVLRHKPQRILLEFVRHFFTKPEILALLKRECSGEINPGITRDALFDLKLPLPEPDEQQRILDGVHQIDAEKRRLYEDIARLDAEIDNKVRASVP